jgi:hypothetical protein
MLVIVCMKTKYMYVKGIADQADLHDKFEEYRTIMKAKDVKYKRVALNINETDHAQNLMSNEMKIWRQTHFIREYQSAPYGQHQNFVESKIQTQLFQGGVACLSSSGFPNFMLHHMAVMKAESMNAHWCEGSELSPLLEERFGIRAHVKYFIPAGTVMYINVDKDNRLHN